MNSLGKAKHFVSMILVTACAAISFAKGEVTAPPFDWVKAEATHLNSKKTMKLLTNANAKLYLVDLWASWCGPCLESFPYFAKLQKEFGERGLVILGVSLDTDIGEALAFAKKSEVSYELFHDQAKKLKTELKIPAIPYLFFVDAKGKQVGSHRGFDEEAPDLIRKQLIQLLADQSK